MKIDTNSSQIYAGRRSAAANARAGSSEAFSNSLAEAISADAATTNHAAPAAQSAISQNKDGADTQPTDFSRMTRKELFDWMNGQLRAGQMTFDQSIPFLGMTMQMPVGADGTTPVVINDNEQVDFLQLAQAGLEDARFRKDAITERLLTTAASIMQRHQGENARMTTLA